MYHTDSFTYKINSYRYDQTTGEVGDVQQFHSTKEYQGLHKPDGACVNSKGQIWSAHYDGKCIELMEPHLSQKPGIAGVSEQINMPVSKVTCPAIGGPDMNWMFITTAKNATEQQSGGIYVAKVATKGLPEARFNDI